MANTVIGLYNDTQTAERVVEELASNGFDRDRIDLKRKDAAGKVHKELAEDGVPRDDAEYYAEGVQGGGVLVAVKAAESRSERAADIMSRFADREASPDGRGSPDRTGAHRTEPRAGDEATRHRADRADDVEGEAHIPVTEERLQVGKREVERGGVRVRTFVTEAEVEEDVTLRDESVHVERRAADRPVDPNDPDAFEEQTIELTETDEEAVVEKEARVVEEVVVGKDVEQRTETVRDTVRQTDVEVDETAADPSRQASFRGFDEEFRKHHQSAPYGDEYSYEQVEPVYRYGHSVATSDRYAGRDWAEIEPEVRREWEARNAGSWDRFGDTIRYSWKRSRGNPST